MTIYRTFFEHPSDKNQREYEALRDFYLNGTPGKDVAQKFGYTLGTFKNLCCQFRKNPYMSFFLPTPKKEPAPDSLRARILELRKTRKVSIYEIQQLLEEEGRSASPSYISKVLRAAGLPSLPRGPKQPKPIKAPPADVATLDLSPRSFSTSCGGLFLFMPDPVQMDMDALVQDFPGSDKIPASHMVRSLLALKLWGIGRPSRVMSEALDEGLALFAGLNAIPKRSSLTEYTGRCDPHFTQEFTHAWFDAAAQLDPGLKEKGESFDLDFHTIPYHGDQALMEKHYVSKRSRRQLGILTFLVRDASTRIFTYANTTVHKKDHSMAIHYFIEDWKQRTGSLPSELVFDSGVTTYAQLAKIHAQKIGFITLRKRHKSMVQAAREQPANQWRSITLTNIGRKYRHPRVLEQKVRLKGYPDEVRQLAIDGLGRDQLMFLITNQTEPAPAKVIDRYARRMMIENVISDTIDFFHMDALSAAVPMKIHVDLQLTLIAGLLYRLLGIRVGERKELAETRTLFRELIPKRAKIHLTEKEIIVQYPRRAHNPLLMNAEYHKVNLPIPWLDNKSLRIEFA